MPRKKKPSGKEKWSWEEINQGHKLSEAEKIARRVEKRREQGRSALIAHIRESGVGGPLTPEELADVLGTIKIKATIVLGKPS